MLTTGAALPWLRGAVRRPGRGLLVVVGLWAMTVAVVAALVAADTLDDLFVEDARARSGAVDVAVTSVEGPFLDEGLARSVGAEGEALSARWSPRLVLDAVASTDDENDATRREPFVQLIGVTADEQRLTAPLTGAGVTDPLRLGPDEVLVNRRLAERVGVEPGDPLDLVIAVPALTERNRSGRVTEEREPVAVPWRVTVRGVADDKGLADAGRAPVALTRLDALQRTTDLRGKVTGLYAASAEPGEEGAEALIDAYRPITRLAGLTGVAVKEDALSVAEEEGGLFRGILLSLAIVVVVASAVVTVHLVVLLGEERRREIAVLRALGARTGTVTRLLVAEGAVYAAVAVVAGAVVALPVGELLAIALADHFAALELARGREQVPLRTAVRPTTVALGVVLVLAVAVASLRAGARRVAAMDVEQVLRGLPVAAEPAQPVGLRRPLIAWSFGLLLLGAGLGGGRGSDLLRFLGLSLVLIAAWLHLRRGPQDRAPLDTRAAAVGLIWCLVAPAALGDFARGGGGVESAFGLLVFAGGGAVACATLLVGPRLRTVMRFVRGYLPRSTQAPLAVAGAYAEQSRLRVGTVTGVVGGTLFMVAALAVLGTATDLDLDRQRGGFDVVGRAVAPVDLPALDAAPGVARIVAVPAETLPETAFAVEDDDDARSSVPYPVTVLRADAALAQAQQWALADALPEFKTSGDALRHLVATPDTAVLTLYTRPDGARPGDTVLLDDGRGPREYTLLAVLDTYALDGVLLGPAAYDEVFARGGPRQVLATAAQGTSASELAATLNDAAADRGLVARTVAQAADDVVQANRRFTDLFAVLLVLGLAVALVAVAALLSRATRERGASLAVLRALGLRRRAVVLCLVAEPLLVAVVGIVVGTAAGLAVLRLLFAFGLRDLTFDVAWTQLGAVAGLTVLGLLLLAVPPAWAAARRDPARSLGDLG